MDRESRTRESAARESGAGTLQAVCVVDRIRPLGRKGVVDSAIDKRPVDGLVDITTHGVVGDRCCDTKFHGDIDQAVYAYDDAEAQRWRAELGKPLPPGWFGENFRVEGVAVTDAVIGTRWSVGTTELEVTVARKPCATFERWSGEPRWIKRFTERADVGAYLRVVKPGSVKAGDRIRVLSVPDHGATVRELFTLSNPDGFRKLLTLDDLPAKVLRDATKVIDADEKFGNLETLGSTETFGSTA